ncbi:MAG TPA: phosphopyruvate hydratase [Candidatus Bathyarchaeia archaeon]|nr:phosphopyruvate hydratase [Candidatus Bathyarchaeia archaeon]
MKITHVSGQEIYDSRGIPTVLCSIVLDNAFIVSASVPSGLSRGTHEAVELRDGGKRLWGMGVRSAIASLEKNIAPLLMDKEPNMVEMDIAMIEADGTVDKHNFGANAMLAASIALCRAQSHILGIEPYVFIAHLCQQETVSIPIPCVNVINGGRHADNNIFIQEIMLVPLGMQTFSQAFEAILTVNSTLKELLKKANKRICVGDEGGFAPDVETQKQALDFVCQAIALHEQDFDGHFALALDMAASQWYDPSRSIYILDGQEHAAQDLIDWYEQLIAGYPIYMLEDGLSDCDWLGWQQMTERLGNNVKIIGDDIFATHPTRIWQGIEHKAAHGSIIKPNQIGTITETLQAAQLCLEHNWMAVISHRSGETVDPFVADIAVGTSAGYIKGGGCSHGESMAKYNRLLEIETTLL